MSHQNAAGRIISLIDEFSQGCAKVTDFFTYGREMNKEEQENCPYIDHPLESCYFMNLDSLVIPDAVKYCLGDFKACPIFNDQPYFS